MLIILKGLAFNQLVIIAFAYFRFSSMVFRNVTCAIISKEENLVFRLNLLDIQFL